MEIWDEAYIRDYITVSPYKTTSYSQINLETTRIFPATAAHNS